LFGVGKSSFGSAEAKVIKHKYKLSVLTIELPARKVKMGQIKVFESIFSVKVAQTHTHTQRPDCAKCSHPTNDREKLGDLCTRCMRATTVKISFGLFIELI